VHRRHPEFTASHPQNAAGMRRIKGAGGSGSMQRSAGTCMLSLGSPAPRNKNSVAASIFSVLQTILMSIPLYVPGSGT
jgi:hypothetical protein